MKTQLIMLDAPVIVSDEEIKKGDYFLADEKYIILCKEKGSETFINGNFYRSKSQKIIAGIEGLPSIDWNGLEEEFGWVDVDKLSMENIGFPNRLDDYDNIRFTSFIEGFNKAQSLNEKKFSLEDMEKALTNISLLAISHTDDLDQTCCPYRNAEYRDIVDLKDVINEFKKLQQPKVFDIEIEMEDYKSNGYSAPYKVKPKITNNSIKILKKL